MRLYPALTRVAVAGALLGSFVPPSCAQTAAEPAPAAAEPQPSSSTERAAVALPAMEVVGQKKKPKRKPATAAFAAKAAAESGAGTAPPAEVFPEGAIAAPAAPNQYSEEQRAAYGATGSVNYISGESINRFSGTSPADFLRGVPGVTIGETRNGGGIDANIRGMQGQRRIAVTVDGADSTIDSYRGYAGVQQRTYIDPDLMGGATITKGPSASQGAIGGTIAMTTINAEDILRAGQSMGVRLRGGIASNSTAEPTEFRAKPETRPSGLFDPEAGNGSLAFAIRQRGFDIVGGYAVRDQGNYFAGTEGRDFYRKFNNTRFNTSEIVQTVGRQYREGEEVLNSSVETESLLLKTVIRPTDSQTLELSYRTFDSEMGEIMPSQILRATSNSSVPQWRPGLYDLDTYTAKYRIAPHDNALIDFKLNGSYSELNSDAFNNPAGEGPIPPGVPSAESSDPGYRYAYGALMESKRFNLEATNTSRIATSVGNFKIDYGSSYSLEDLSPTKGAYEPTQADLENNKYFRSAVRQEANAFGSLQWQPIKALTLEAGGRYSYFNTRDRNQRAKRTPSKWRWVTYSELRPGGGTLTGGQMRWFADLNGIYQAANDPRNDPNAIVFRLGSPPMTRAFYLANFPVSNPASPRLDADNAIDYFSGTYEKPIEREDAGFAPNASVTLEVLSGAKVYAKYAEGLRMPGIYESSVGHFAATSFEALRPEHAKNWEFGASTVQRMIFTPRDEAMLKLSFFNNKVDDYISRFAEIKFEATSPFRDISTYNFENNDVFQTRGLELQAAYDAGVMFFEGSVTKYLNATTCNARRAATLRAKTDRRYANTPDCIDGGFIGSFANIQNPPEYTFSATGGVRLFNERLTLGGRYLYNSEPISKLDKIYHGTDTDLARQLTYDKPVVLVDLFSSYKVTEDSEFTFGVDNVANRYYIDPLTVSFMPSPGRTYKAGFSAKF